MSLSNALSNAISGIAAASRGTEVVASNLANALTPGFARRELQISARPFVSAGGGVHVDGVTRVVNTSVLAQSRLAAAETARAGTLATFHKSMSDAVGVPGEPGALSTLLADLDSALVTAAARPENETGLAQVVTAARTLAGAYNVLGAQIQEARATADRAIAADVDALNGGLERIVELNRQITIQAANGGDANTLLDERQRIIDSLSEILPVKALPRDGGGVALFTASGGVLLDGITPTRFAFSPAGTVTPGMEAGGLGLLMVNGNEVPAAQMGRFGGGRLAASFQIRDVDGPLAQARLDAAALDLHDRFAQGVDQTIASGDPGLFADAFGPADPSGIAGLAQRLVLNPAVDPATGGAMWRLRDGIGAGEPGPVGNAGLLIRMHEALSAARVAPSAAFGAVPRSAATLAAELTSAAASGWIDAERRLSAATAQASTYESMLRQDGVDSDREMEALLVLERAYASNAKVLQAVDEMLQTMLRIT